MWCDGLGEVKGLSVVSGVLRVLNMSFFCESVSYLVIFISSLETLLYVCQRKAGPLETSSKTCKFLIIQMVERNIKFIMNVLV